jgi:hypothetical protein
MPCIYETVNLVHLNNNIYPYRYIGSDQTDRNWYLGSSKSLKEDIKKYGKNNFYKKIIKYYDNISNIELREEESKIQKEINCASDNSYYNKTNASYKGYVLSDEEKLEKGNQLQKEWKKWRNSLKETDDYYINNRLFWIEISKKINTIDYWIEKHGDRGDDLFKKFKEKQSSSRKGEKNPASKYSDEVKEKCINLFFNEKMKRNDIVKITGISYGVLKLIIRNYKKKGLIITTN